MLALIGAALGLLGSVFPRLIGLFEAKQNHKQEMAMLKLQSEFQLQMMTAGHAAKMAEINATADIASERMAMTAAMKPSGVKWIDGFNAFVRPFLTIAFFGLYAGVKVGQFYLLLGDAGAASAFTSLWNQEDWAIWAAIITFWFGNRTFNKERGRA
ncbi:MAG TPA: hypothetical protein VEC14_07855 [Reyranellaceae bacterium]|nr:hypothetical protein [Reyranellaceae bacterium]